MKQMIWSVVALLLIYGGWQFLRALRLGERRRFNLLGREQNALKGLDEDLFNYAPVPAKEPELATTVIVESNSRPADVERNLSLNQTPNAFAAELEIQRLRREIDDLRDAMQSQRQEIDTLRLEMKHATARLTAAPGISPAMSPEYDEALAMARRGVLADVIAARCGISRAEADLVTSLAARSHRRGAEGRLS